MRSSGFSALRPKSVVARFIGRTLHSSHRLNAPADARRQQQHGGVAGAVAGLAKLKPELQSPSWHELYQAAVLARWSGFTYHTTDSLMKKAEADNLKVVAHGRNEYTSWFVADGSINYSTFMSSTLNTAGPASGPAGSRPSSGSWNGSMDGDNILSQPPPSPTTSSLLVPPGNDVSCRFVFVRGVHMAAPETNVLNMWRLLADMWPSPFAGDLTNPAGALVSHPGVSSVAKDLFKSIAPHLQTKQPVFFVGHSLGGAIGKLLWALAILHGCRPAAQMGVFSFGSPPVLAHNEGGGGERVLELLGATSSPPVDFVLQHDPIPRSMISVDPYFTTAKRYLPVAGLLQARSWLLGAGSTVSSDRFLFENVGRMFMIQGGCQVIPVGTKELENLMSMDDLTDAVSQPGSLLKYWLDHHHGSYAHDLHTAAISALRRSARAAAAIRKEEISF